MPSQPATLNLLLVILLVRSLASTDSPCLVLLPLSSGFLIKHGTTHGVRDVAQTARTCRQKVAHTHVGLCYRARYSTPLPFTEQRMKKAVTFERIPNLRTPPPQLIVPPSLNALMCIHSEDKAHTHIHTPTQYSQLLLPSLAAASKTKMWLTLLP